MRWGKKRAEESLFPTLLMHGLGEIGSVVLTGLRFCQRARRSLSVSREYFSWSLLTLKNLILWSVVLGQKQHIDRTFSFAMLPYTYMKAGETCYMFCAPRSLPRYREEAIKLLAKDAVCSQSPRTGSSHLLSVLKDPANGSPRLLL